MIWEKQWELFAPNFKNGKAHIETPVGVIQLLPGPGFGDYSHPTTRLTCKLMATYVPGKDVVDIGCGSGILSFAAAKMGARFVYGYDIDPEAVQHANQNLKLNPGPITFANQAPSIDQGVVVMNMISSEQLKAWKNHFRPEMIITSGILEPDPYLAWTQTLGWQLHQALCEDGWYGFVFINNL